MAGPEGVVGVVLAGGRSSRMGGSDKALLSLAGRPLLAHVIERLRPQVAKIVLNANGDPARFATFALPVVPDRFGGHMGPLSGIHAGLEWVRENRPESRFIVTVAADTPFFPADLVSRLSSATNVSDPRLVVACSGSGVHPVFGLWPVSLAARLEAALYAGERKALDFTTAHRAQEVTFPPIEIGGRPVDPFFNINRPEDLVDYRLGAGTAANRLRWRCVSVSVRTL